MNQALFRCSIFQLKSKSIKKFWPLHINLLSHEQISNKNNLYINHHINTRLLKVLQIRLMLPKTVSFFGFFPKKKFPIGFLTVTIQNMQTAMKAAWDVFCKAEKPALSLTGGKTLSRKFNMLCDCTFDLIKETKMQMLTSHYSAQRPTDYQGTVWHLLAAFRFCKSNK